MYLTFMWVKGIMLARDPVALAEAIVERSRDFHGKLLWRSIHLGAEGGRGRALARGYPQCGFAAFGSLSKEIHGQLDVKQQIRGPVRDELSKKFQSRNDGKWKRRMHDVQKVWE